MLLLAFALSGNVVYSQIAQRGSATTATIASAAASMTINKPTGVVAGDVLIVTVLQNETDNDNGGLSDVTATGWTLIDGRIIRSVGIANGDNAWYGTVLYRVADGTEGSSFAFALPNSRADMAIGSMVAFSGATATGGQTKTQQATEQARPRKQRFEHKQRSSVQRFVRLMEMKPTASSNVIEQNGN